MPYLDSIFVTEEQHAEIAARCKKINDETGTDSRTFSEAMVEIIGHGLDVMASAEALTAPVMPAGDVQQP